MVGNLEESRLVSTALLVWTLGLQGRSLFRGGEGRWLPEHGEEWRRQASVTRHRRSRANGPVCELEDGRAVKCIYRVR